MNATEKKGKNVLGFLGERLQRVKKKKRDHESKQLTPESGTEPSTVRNRRKKKKIGGWG